MAAKIISSGNTQAGANNMIAKLQNLLAALEYNIGGVPQNWFSLILPIVEISQTDEQPLFQLVGNDYGTVIHDNEKCTAFFLLDKLKQQEARDRFLADLTLLVWYRTPNFSKFRSVKQVLVNELQNKVFRQIPQKDIESIEYILNWQQIWQGLNVNMYELQSTHPFDCLRVDLQIYLTMACLPTNFESDITNLTQC